MANALQYILSSQEMPPIPPNAEASAVEFLGMCLKREHKERPYAEELLRHKFILEL